MRTGCKIHTDLDLHDELSCQKFQKFSLAKTEPEALARNLNGHTPSCFGLEILTSGNLSRMNSHAWILRLIPIKWTGSPLCTANRLLISRHVHGAPYREEDALYFRKLLGTERVLHGDEVKPLNRCFQPSSGSDMSWASILRLPFIPARVERNRISRSLMWQGLDGQIHRQKQSCPSTPIYSPSLPDHGPLPQAQDCCGPPGQTLHSKHCIATAD